MSTIVRIADHYGKRVERDGSVRIPCPHHNGEDDNCAVFPNEDGDGLAAKCWSHDCEPKAIFDALRELGLVPKHEPRERERRPKERVKPRRWEYTHPNGFRVTTFRQDFPGACWKEDCKREDPHKEIWQQPKGDRKGFLLRIFNPQPNAAITVTEGESDAEAAAAAGLTSASYLGGTSNVRNADYSPLKDREVVVWPDNDAPGIRAGNVVVEKAWAAGARSVAVVQQPPESGKGWGAADFSEEERRQLVSEADPQERPDQDREPAAPDPDIPVKPDKDKMREMGWLMDYHGNLRELAIENACKALSLIGCEYRYDEWNANITDRDGKRVEVARESVRCKRLIERKLYSLGMSYTPSKTLVADAIEDLAWENPFNPVVDLLRSEAWDGEDRLGHLGYLAFGTPDTDLWNLQAALIVRGAVIRALEPGCIFPYVPVVYSKLQGVAKRDTLEIIAPGGYVDALSFRGIEWEKKLGEKMGGKSVGEVNEWSGRNEDALDAMKIAATMTQTRYRAAYAKTVTDNPIRGIFALTTNRRHMLTDSEHRRNPVIEVPAGQEINLDWLKLNITQLWAQVVHEYDLGAYSEFVGRDRRTAVRLPREFWAQANENSALYSVTDDLPGVLEKAVTDAHGDYIEFVPSSAVRKVLGKLGLKPDNSALSRAMDELGYRSGVQRITGRKKPCRGWCVTDVTHQNEDLPDCSGMEENRPSKEHPCAFVTDLAGWEEASGKPQNGENGKSKATQGGKCPSCGRGKAPEIQVCADCRRRNVVTDVRDAGPHDQESCEDPDCAKCAVEVD